MLERSEIHVYYGVLAMSIENLDDMLVLGFRAASSCVGYRNYTGLDWGC